MTRDVAKWWADWQDVDHALKFDFRASAPGRVLIRDLESFNDVRLLNEYLQTAEGRTLLEIGCATGDFFRYLRLRHPVVSYIGLDVSAPAIERAQHKYPAGKFRRIDPNWNVESVLETCNGCQPEIVFCKDVIHHQVQPLDFLERLLKLSSKALIFRGRTRDHGTTEGDPDKSCQYHYSGWMPYIVTNLDELIESIQRNSPNSEVVVYRNHMVLGGKHNRHLPKDCYLKQTGTAETAIGVFKVSKSAGKVSIHDRPDASPVYSAYEVFLLGLLKIARMLRTRS